MYFSILLPQINVEFLIFQSTIVFYSSCHNHHFHHFRPASTPRTLHRCRAPTWTRGCPPPATRRLSWPTTWTRRSSRRWGRWCTAATTPATPSTPATTCSVRAPPPTPQCRTPPTSLPTPPPPPPPRTTTLTACLSPRPSLTPPLTTSPPPARPTPATIPPDENVIKQKCEELLNNRPDQTWRRLWCVLWSGLLVSRVSLCQNLVKIARNVLS